MCRIGSQIEDLQSGFKQRQNQGRDTGGNTNRATACHVGAVEHSPTRGEGYRMAGSAYLRPRQNPLYQLKREGLCAAVALQVDWDDFESGETLVKRFREERVHRRADTIRKPAKGAPLNVDRRGYEGEKKGR